MRKIIVLCLIALLFLSSCSLSGAPFGRGNSFREVNYFQGTEGLRVNFLEQAPPREVFEGSPLDVQLLVENKGAFDIFGNYTARFHITFDSLEMIKQSGSGGSQPSIEPEITYLQIHGKSPTYPQGENYYLFSRDNPFYNKESLNFNAKPIVANFEQNTATVYATTCYPYKTYFSDDVCIDTDPQNIDPRKKVCVAEDKSYSKGQGAPVAITAIETNMVPRGTYVLPQFVIHISHKGEGMVSDFILDDTVCGELTPDTINTFHIDARLGNDNLICYPEIVRFKNGEAESVCKLEQNSIDLASSNYLAPLSVELSYLYTETFSKDISIKRTRPLNLFEEKAINEDFCHSWEEFVPGEGSRGGKCVSACEYYASTRDVEAFRTIALEDPENNPLAYNWPILQQGASMQTLTTAWDSLNCVYGSEAICRQNPSSCIIATDLCQPGTFCGWPSCFDRNYNPEVERPELTDSFLSWSCRDRNDNPSLDPQQTCGCDSVAYWALVDKRTFQTIVGEGNPAKCEELPHSVYMEHEIQGTYNPVFKTMEFRTAPPLFDASNTALCLKVIDKQGNEGFQRFS